MKQDLKKRIKFSNGRVSKYLPRFLQSSLTILAILLVGCNRETENKLPDLPKKDPIWVQSISLDPDSKIRYVGKTKNYLITSVTSVDSIKGVTSIKVGDVIAGIPIGAIQCTFQWKDAYYGGEQYMWRGRWLCMAGRNREEIENAIQDNGYKYDYISVFPITLKKVE